MKSPFCFPQLLLVSALLLLSFSHGYCRKMIVENVSHEDSATVLSSDHPKLAEKQVFHFHLDYIEAGPNFNGKSGFPFTTPPPPSLPPPVLPVAFAPSPQEA